MESYIEIAFVWNTLTICFSCMLSALFVSHPMSLYKTLMICAAYVAIVMMLPAMAVIVIAAELLLHLILFQKQYKLWVMNLSLRALWLLSCYVLLRGGTEGLLWYPSIHDTYMVALFVLLFVLFAVAFPRISLSFLKWNYVYPFQMKTQSFSFKGKGYMDSGNVVSHESIPVIFLSRRVMKDMVLPQPTALVPVRFVSGSDHIACFKGVIQIQGYPKKEVYIGMMDEIKMKRQCAALLNVKLFQSR